ncbi:MAG TPA: YfiR family protein [Vicinamibacterales bacterium]|nr:YfiR family protein [Vicinamibacterales bacterium]
MAVLGGHPLWAAALVVGCLAQATTAFAQAPAPLEANVKAVFLYNFAKYVTWPGTGKIGERSPAEIRICVTANDGFFNLLKTAVQGEDVDGRPLLPVALDGLDAARTCQILYVGDTKSPDARAWLSAVRGRQVLTVGDGDTTQDVVIAFVRDSNRVRFDINRAVAARHSLNVSSKLLRLARQVRDR